MTKCLFQLYDKKDHMMSNCFEAAEWKKGKITPCEAHARYAKACGSKRIKMIHLKKKKGESK